MIMLHHQRKRDIAGHEYCLPGTRVGNGDRSDNGYCQANLIIKVVKSVYRYQMLGRSGGAG